ncbi:hypothetical protein ACEWY4_014460 [Coilia grayii]|uniref:LEM domain-containing protein n=1 Tax=Coilia grayii TaxID=363190 RepID=A0ABD1JSD1_9TELE
MLCETNNLASQLCKAVGNEDLRSVHALLSQGANPNLILEKGVAAIHLAVGKESEKGIRCLKLILQHGADPNLRSSEGLTPLHIAALWGCYQNLKLLLKNGANPNLKDQDGNKAGELARQQDNRRCALLLSEHESQAAQADVEDFPKFQYSVYSGQPGRERSYCSAGDDYSNASLGMSTLSDFSDEPLSSTRRSSSLSFSAVFGRPSDRGARRLEFPDISDLRGPEDSVWDFDPPNVLSSTRVSVAGTWNRSALPALQEDEAFSDRRASRYERGYQMPSDALPPPPHHPAGHARRASRKSVSFRDVDEYFPVFDTESPRQRPTQESSESCDSTVDFSEYTEFFDADRMATVLHHQGIDVTSPDHVFVFSRDDASSDADLEKTVLTWLPTEEENHDESFTDNVSVPKSQVLPPSTSGSSSSSSSGASKYSSCDSEEYKSAIEDISPHDDVHESTEEDECSRECPAAKFQSKTMFPFNGAKTPSDEQAESVIPQTKRDSTQDERGTFFAVEPSTPVAEVTEMMSNLACERKMSNCEVFSPRVKELEDEGRDVVVSPFITGRTRSRLSRCSQRASQSSSSLSTSLFDVTLPTPPTRMRRPIRSQESPVDVRYAVGDGYYASPFSVGRSGGSSASAYSQSQAEVLRSDQYTASYEGVSQADTVILSTSMADTVILEKGTVAKCSGLLGIPKGEGSSSDFGKEDVSSGYEFITDDLSTCSEARSFSPSQTRSLSPSHTSTQSSNRESVEDSWTSEMESQVCSLASISDTPQKNPPDTPGTGCTPRYSMSRLSGHCRPQSLANLSYTPGGRPLLVDVDEPVEYLYTDTEQGHELIETHVPPTSNTSMSSNISSATSDETVLYDWRSFKMSPSKEKENVEPKDDMLKEFKGLTDKELRKRLVELGQAPGPITTRTRPVYMERLRRLQQETNSQSQSVHCNTEHSPELRRTLQTFILPDGRYDEHALSEQFDQPDQNKKWREGVIKSSFNYLLLDPRVTNNLPFRSQAMTLKECFQTFVSAIFYVGKGKRSRPYSHLYEALEYYRGDKTSKKLCSKVKHILAVWNAGHGVISLHCFQNVIPVEAYTREACMVDAIGLKMLTNKKRGDYYGVASTWAAKRKRELGVHLLYRAMQIFLAEGERQLRPADIRA